MDNEYKQSKKKKNEQINLEEKKSQYHSRASLAKKVLDQFLVNMKYIDHSAGNQIMLGSAIQFVHVPSNMFLSCKYTESSKKIKINARKN